MPFLTLDSHRLYYRRDGLDTRPPLILSNSLGCDHAMWDPQMPDLREHFCVVRYDQRGHGVSDAWPGDYTIEALGRDVLALADALGLERFAFSGLSLGGMIGQWLGIHAADRVTKLVFANTSPATVGVDWAARIKLIREGGMPAFVDAAMGRFFSPGVLEANPVAATLRRTFLATNPQGYAACSAAIRDMNHTPRLGEIRTPVLIIGSERDQSTPWAGHGDVLAREIPGARVHLMDTAHISNVEKPRAFTRAVLEFLLDPATGSAVRRRNLGDAHVDRAIARTTEFTRAFQELIVTDFAWGAIWTRPGLDSRTRRLLAVAMMAALGRWEEFRMHVRAGLDRELEACDLEEALLQVAVYAGVPAANTAFQIAREEVER